MKKYTFQYFRDITLIKEHTIEAASYLEAWRQATFLLESKVNENDKGHIQVVLKQEE